MEKKRVVDLGVIETIALWTSSVMMRGRGWTEKSHVGGLELFLLGKGFSLSKIVSKDTLHREKKFPRILVN